MSTRPSSTDRIYLDWNATAPLRPEARAAMTAAMDVVGNPSSVHADGRAARALVEDARAKVAEALGAEGADVIFTSGATEAAAVALAGRGLHCAPVEHDAVQSWCTVDLAVDAQGAVTVTDPASTALQLANPETGVLQDLPRGLAVTDATQALGKVPVDFAALGADMLLVSAHKLGGPKGVGALVIRRGLEITAQIRGGGQEMGRRSGTENVIGIAGFGAAAVAAQRDLRDGHMEEVRAMRDRLEAWLIAAAPGVQIVAAGAPRLPNVSCLVSPGWKGETQVMLMDLAGISVSAGSACSSGKVRPSKVLAAMGLDAMSAASALRVSIGHQTLPSDLERFVEVWAGEWRKFAARAA